MARGALRGMAGGVLTLVVLQGLTGKGAGRVGGLVDTISGLVSRALDPNVPAIPDHSHPAGGSSSSSAGAGATVPGAYVNGQPIPAGLEHAGATAGSLAGLGNGLNDYLSGLSTVLTPHPTTRVRVPAAP